MTQPPPPDTVTANATMSPADEKMWSILTHLGGIFFYTLVPLVAFLVLKDRGPFVRWHTRQALNFHITLLIAYVVGLASTFLLVGFFVLAAAGILQITFGILAALAANRGEFYRVPVAIEFVK